MLMQDQRRPIGTMTFGAGWATQRRMEHLTVEQFVPEPGVKARTLSVPKAKLARHRLFWHQQSCPVPRYLRDELRTVV